MPPASPLVRLLPLLAVISLAAWSCGHGKEATIAPKTAGPRAGATSAEVAVRLLDAGAEPRAPLRYRIAAGQTETLVMELSTKLKLALGDMSPPSIRSPSVRVNLEVQSLAERQPLLTLVGKIVAVEVPDDPGVAPQVIAAVRSDLDHLSKTRFTAVFTDRGLLERLDLAGPTDANPQLQTTLERIRESLRLLLPPLPDAPVGRNARWEAHRRTTVGPARVEETALYKLGAADGHALLAVTLGMDATEQPLTMPGTPPGATLTLSSFEGGGKGQINLMLAHIVQPSTMRWAASGRGTATPAGEPPSPITLTIDASAVIRRR